MNNCTVCGRTLNAEFQLGQRCHNTEACKRRRAQKALAMMPKKLRVKPEKTYKEYTQ